MERKRKGELARQDDLGVVVIFENLSVVGAQTLREVSLDTEQLLVKVDLLFDVAAFFLANQDLSSGQIKRVVPLVEDFDLAT